MKFHVGRHFIPSRPSPSFSIFVLSWCQSFVRLPRWYYLSHNKFIARRVIIMPSRPAIPNDIMTKSFVTVETEKKWFGVNAILLEGRKSGRRKRKNGTKFIPLSRSVARWGRGGSAETASRFSSAFSVFIFLPCSSLARPEKLPLKVNS